jgi:SAM-dependent methyltransferase
VSDTEIPRFYEHLACWWPLLSPVEEYAEEADFYGRLLKSAGSAPARTLLELGSGGGNNASYLKRQFQTTLVDPAEGMLALSRQLNPECEHVRGDMRTVRLDREFDRVFIHDAIVYMTSERDLRLALETAHRHCRAGGAALFAPDYVKENFRPGTDHGGHDDQSRGLRYLEWMLDPDPADTTYTVDYAFLLREGDRELRVEHDRHIEGLFSRLDWLRILEDVGFEPEVVPFEHSELEPGSHEVFLCVKPER